MKEIKPIFRAGKYRDLALKFRIFKCEYPWNNPTKEVDAIFLQVGHSGFWIFRNQEIGDNWPQQAR